MFPLTSLCCVTKIKVNSNLAINRIPWDDLCSVQTNFPEECGWRLFCSSEFFCHFLPISGWKSRLFPYNHEISKSPPTSRINPSWNSIPFKNFATRARPNWKRREKSACISFFERTFNRSWISLNYQLKPPLPTSPGEPRRKCGQIKKELEIHS